MSDVAKKAEAPDPAYLAAVLRQRQAMQAQLDRAKAMFAVIDTDATALLAQQYQATKSTKAEVTLPDGSTSFATVTRIPGVAEAEITDRDAFHAWVRDTYPEQWGFRVIPARTETVVEGAFADQVLAAVNAANSAEYADPESGVVHKVPGVAIRPKRKAYFKWLFTRASKTKPLDGRDLAAQAVRAGLISTDTPPALPPAEHVPPSDAAIAADTVRTREEMFAAAARVGITHAEADRDFQAVYGHAAVWGTAEQLRAQVAAYAPAAEPADQ